MSGTPKLHSNNVTDSDARPILEPTGNKARPSSLSRKTVLKPLRGTERSHSDLCEEKKSSSMVTDTPPFSPPVSPSLAALRRQKLLLQSNFSLNASCSSDASTDSFCSRASTGRIGRPNFTSKRRQGVPKPEKIAAKLEEMVADGAVVVPGDTLQTKKRCAWVTPNTDSAYVTFHDEEWGIPVHDDRKLFELLVLSGALAELTWPAILNKRQIFRQVFMDFDPVLVSRMSEKKLIAPGSIPSTLLSEAKLRAVVENGRLILKIIEEFGSFDEYCWSFVNHKPIVSRFRYPRHIPVKTPKADSISKDLVRRGFRGVGPTVMYSFMQASGMTNDHVTSCFRLEECCDFANLTTRVGGGSTGAGEETRVNGIKIEGMEDIVLDLVGDVESVSVL
ncbi:hypothetical protein KSP39_PZI021855 [Platanthera zijinensis]|uniref:DNA-3-methyladenine glycosylase I n=1 Tax=Platanthera zijinensis TaxID=2320716 RepID=A0AAP0AX53_9ASPA